jgi:hypothetical protein
MPDYMRVDAVSRFGYASLNCLPKDNFSPPQQRRGKINTKLSRIAPKERLAKSYNYSLHIVRPLHGNNQIDKLSNKLIPEATNRQPFSLIEVVTGYKAIGVIQDAVPGTVGIVL